MVTSFSLYHCSVEYGVLETFKLIISGLQEVIHGPDLEKGMFSRDVALKVRCSNRVWLLMASLIKPLGP